MMSNVSQNTIQNCKMIVLLAAVNPIRPYCRSHCQTKIHSQAKWSLMMSRMVVRHVGHIAFAVAACW